MKWAVVDKFSDYLYGGSNVCTVYTDNNSLTYVLTTAKIDATGHHWLAALAAYNLEIKYCSGHTNINADILSHLPVETIEKSEDLCVVDQQMIDIIKDGVDQIPFVDSHDNSHVCKCKFKGY